MKKTILASLALISALTASSFAEELTPLDSERILQAFSRCLHNTVPVETAAAHMLAIKNTDDHMLKVVELLENNPKLRSQLETALDAFNSMLHANRQHIQNLETVDCSDAEALAEIFERNAQVANRFKELIRKHFNFKTEL